MPSFRVKTWPRLSGKNVAVAKFVQHRLSLSRVVKELAKKDLENLVILPNTDIAKLDNKDTAKLCTCYIIIQYFYEMG